MATYALIQNGVVVNIIIWDGPDVTPMIFGDDVSFAKIPDDDNNSPSSGWTYDDGKFTAPPISDDQLKAQSQQEMVNNLSAKESAITSATQKVVPLQTKLLLGRKLSDDETSSLNALLDYLDALEAFDANKPGELEWPQLAA